MNDERPSAATASARGRRTTTRAATSTLLRRVRLGTRVSILLAVPVIGLLIMVAVTAFSAWNAMSEAQADGAKVEAAIASVELADAIAEERCSAVSAELGQEFGANACGPYGSEDFAGNETTERSAQDAHAAILQAGLPATEAIERLTTVRMRNAGNDPELASIGYDRLVVESLVALDEFSTPDAGLTQLFRAFHAARLAQADLARQEVVLRYAAESRLDASAARQAASDAIDAEREHLDVLARFASDETLTLLTATTLDPDWRSTREAIRLLATGTPIDEIDARPAGREKLVSALVQSAQTDLEHQLAARTRRARSALAITFGVASFLLLAAIAAAAALSRSIVEPLAQVRGVTQRLIEGEFRSIQQSPSTDEVGDVESSLVTLNAMLSELQTQADSVEARANAGDPSARIEGVFPGAWGLVADGINRSLEATERSLARAEAAEQIHVATSDILATALAASDFAELAGEVKRQLNAATDETACRLVAAADRPIPPQLAGVIDAGPPLSIASHGETVRLHQHGYVELVRPVEDARGPVAFLCLRLTDAPRYRQRDVSMLFEVGARTLTQAYRTRLAESQMQHRERHDAETGLANNMLLREWLSAALATPDGRTTSVIVIQPLDLDASIVSRTWSQRSTMTIAAARRIRSTVGPASIVARLSSTEFAVAQTGGDAATTAQRLIEAFAHPVSLGIETVNVALAVGFAIDDDPNVNHANELLEAAVAACSEDARSDSASPTRYRPELRTELQRRRFLTRWLDRFVETGEGIEMWLQPIHELPSRRIVGYEALARGTADGEAISPGEFIPLAEETGRIGAIGEHMLRLALRAAGRLPVRQQFISVNVSPLQLRSDNLVATIAQAFRRSGTDPNRIVLEITEGAVVDTQGDMVDRLTALRALGVGVAIDDFGTGYSSLSYLAALPIDVIKLDRAFVATLGSESTFSVAEHTVRLGHDLGVTIVAEGVETEQQLRILSELGCDRVQGFLLGRPAPAVSLVPSPNIQLG